MQDTPLQENGAASVTSLVVICIEMLFFALLSVLACVSCVKFSIKSNSTNKNSPANMDNEETDFAEEIRHHQFSFSTNTYTILLLFCLVFFGIIRAFQCVFLFLLKYAQDYDNTFVDSWFYSEEASEDRMNDIFWFLFIVGLAPYYSTFSSIIFQWYLIF